MIDIKLQIPQDFFKEEERSGFLVSSKIKEVWAIELDILAEIMRICREHDIKFFACGGTILGAVRHKGFIPWDDDIDIMMFRKDYDKFCSIAPQEFKHPYFFQTEETDKGSAHGHAKIRNSLTTGMSRFESMVAIPYNKGIFVDVFPLDNFPDDEQEAVLFREQSNNLKSEYLKRYKYVYYQRKNRKGIRKIVDIMRKFYYQSFKSPYSVYYQRYEKIIRKYDETSSSQLTMPPFIIPRFTWYKEDLKDTVDMDFEFLSIPVPVGYERMLSTTYGEWRKFVRGGAMHTGMIFDTNTSYSDYLSFTK